MTDMKQNHRNGPRAESASPLGPGARCTRSDPTTSQERRGVRDGRSSGRGVEGLCRMSLQHLGRGTFHCNGAQLANTTQHRVKPLQTAGKRQERSMKEERNGKENTRMINGQKRNEEIENIETERRNKEE